MMSLYEAFAIGKIREYDSYREVIDYVIPNHEIIEENMSSIQWIKNYPTILEYLDKNYIKKKIEFSIKSHYGTPYHHAYLNGDILVAVITTIENHPQIYLSQYIKRELKEKNASIIRCYSDRWMYSLNTKTSFFEMPRLEYSKNEIISFYEYYWQYSSDFICDLITKKDSIVLFSDSYSWEVLGTFEKPISINEYFKKNFEEKPLPFQEMEICDGFWSGCEILASCRETEKGKEIYISREGYSFLAKNNLSIIRAKKITDKDEIWEKLDVIFTPEVWK